MRYCDPQVKLLTRLETSAKLHLQDAAQPGGEKDAGGFGKLVC